MKVILKFLNFVLITGFLLIAAGIAYITIPSFGNKALIVRSGSMEPSIGVGSIIVVRGGENFYKQGEVIAFKSEKNPNTIITHRIDSVTKSGTSATYKTKGDANEEVDSWQVRNANVVGKVNFTIPYAGKFFSFVKSRDGFLTMIVLPAVLVILLESINIIKEIRKGRRKIILEDNPFGFTSYPTTTPQISNKRLIGRMGFKMLVAFIVAGGILIPGTFALMNDNEVSAGNVFQASDDFGFTDNNNLTEPEGFIMDTERLEIIEPEASNTPTPTVFPTASPSVSPSPSLSPSPVLSPSTTVTPTNLPEEL